MKTADLKKKSLNAEVWEQATLDVIASQGLSAVAVEALARSLGVTKGSFYWHFSNRMDLISASLKRWRSNDRRIIRKKVLGIQNPKKRLKAWFMLSAEPYQSHLIYATLLADRHNDMVAKILKEVTIERLNYIQDAYEQIGYERGKAKQQAVLAYSVYVGYLHMAKTLHGNHKTNLDIEEYVQHVVKQLIN